MASSPPLCLPDPNSEGITSSFLSDSTSGTFKTHSKLKQRAVSSRQKAEMTNRAVVKHVDETVLASGSIVIRLCGLKVSISKHFFLYKLIVQFTKS